MANSTDKSILTSAGKALLAQLNAEEKALVIDKMIFANVPNRPEYPQPDDVVPTEHIVHQEQVEQRGRLSADSVIYSSTLTSDVGPFDFNWTGAYCSEYGVLVTIDHHALTPKTADEPGVAGNTLVRSVVLEYKDIAEITNITVDASSWQYNATERMKKMDSDVAQSIIDQNGKDWFIEDGFLVTPSGSAYSIKAGAGYVSGNRVAMEFDRSVQVPNKPSFIYIDAHREGTPTGEQVTLFDFVVTADEKDDYTDANGVKHFVCKIAQVLADGSVSDFRNNTDTNEVFTQQAQKYRENINVSNKLMRVEYEGVVYMPRKPFVGFVTTKTFDASKWVVVNTANVPSIKELTEKEIHVTSFQSIRINSYHEGFNAVYSPPTGEGEFVWRPDLSKSMHDGGVYIDPTKTFPSDFSNEAQLKDWFTNTNTGYGVFVRVFSGQYAVQWYGAIEGDYDNTHVFNAATQAHLDYGDIIRKRITCYGVKFTVLGTVFLRLGQTLDFKGSRVYMGATGSIKLGYNNRGDKDSGGHPPYVMNLWCEGGFNPLDINVSGYYVINCFFSMPVAPVVLDGIDGHVSGLIVDNASVGVAFGASNTTVIGMIFYRCQTQVKFYSGRSSTFVACHFNYADVNSILIDNLGYQEVKELKDFKFVDCKFRLNAQNQNFNGFVKTHGSAIRGDFKFCRCEFRNGKKAAVVNESTSSDLTLDFDDCSFDGRAAISTETQSDSFYVYEHGNNAKAVVRFKNPKVNYCFDTPFKIGGIEIAQIEISNAEYVGISASHYIDYSNTNGSSLLKIKNAEGDGGDLINHVSNSSLEIIGEFVNCFRAKTESNREYFELPTYGATLIDIAIAANRNPSGSAQYRAINKYTLSKTYNYVGGKVVTQGDIQNTFKSTASLGELDVSLDIDVIGQGLVKDDFHKKSNLLLSTNDQYGNKSLTVRYDICNG
ncbi:phage tail-collar fiber domain-containing protein [Vibrio parahaemolyticus]|uniref:phage tail-collar fiber domain-containing protein n=1 Tax=Vibrio parahaemolyticus TaxID=670 RepID=UPI002269E3CA|nr:phage tail protein [Vibrio parahaemolyticus]MCX8761324.1 phage tail protein [Vibrio parahaemolyticus]